MPFARGTPKPPGSGRKKKKPDPAEERSESLFARIRHPKKRAFLLSFSQTGHVGQSCAAAQLDRHMPALWCGHEPTKMARDDDFALAYEYAQQLAGQSLEDEVIRRGRDGWLKPLYANGKRVLDLVLNEDGTVKMQAVLNADGTPMEVAGKPLFVETWKPAFVLEHSDTLLIFATKGALPGKYRDTMSHRLVDGQGNDRSLLAEFDRLVETAEQAP